MMNRAVETLTGLGVKTCLEVSSAHRQPDRTKELAMQAKTSGYSAVICGAGLSAALPGVVAAYTRLPVIGVPLSASPLGGLDALLSISQMPKGVPVACMAIGSHGAVNAALLAARIIALSDEEVASNLEEYVRQLERS
jgi:phosphoribosylaminoimidazole carboxylase PurE protein